MAFCSLIFTNFYYVWIIFVYIKYTNIGCWFSINLPLSRSCEISFNNSFIRIPSRNTFVFV